MTSPISNTCDYCGLFFQGQGYTPVPAKSSPHTLENDEDSPVVAGPRAGHNPTYCCYGCFLVQKIIGSRREGGVSDWIILRLGIGAFLSMNVMMISLLLYTSSLNDLGKSTESGMRWALLILSTPALFILASPFVLNGVRDLRRRKVGTDALITTGSLAAYGVSTAHVLAGGGQVYFDTATMLLVLVTLGRLLEASAKISATKAVRSAVDLIPQTARVIRNFIEMDIPADDIKLGDELVVKPGEHIPADGVIISGKCMVEESSFTGESLPRSCSPGDSVFGGSINYDGLIRVQVQAVKADSMLGRIKEMVVQAQQGSIPFHRMVDRATSVLAPAVWLISLGAAVYWSVLHHNPERAGLSALAVLVVACPCALGIAAPLSTSLAIGRAAREGILVRSGEIFERLSQVGKVFLDKSGTLTSSELIVAEVQVDAGADRDVVLSWAASLEHGSEHAIGRSIIAAAKAAELTLGRVEDFKMHPGQGVEGAVSLGDKRSTVTLGTLELLVQHHSMPETLIHLPGASTAVYVGWEGKVRAAILLNENIRLEGYSFVENLRNRGLDPVIISGDRKASTYRLAQRLGVGTFFPECTPARKLEIIRAARETPGKLTAMVGDGVNDAPSLAEADVGIAVGSGTDLARQSSDVILLGNDLGRIPWLLDLSKTTCRIIRQNLWWAFGYNSIAVALAFAGLLHPLLAAIAMILSSISVIANSMRLTRFPLAED